MVVLDHLVHWPSGGFVGVDVFFVISGFLITGLLIREYERSGTISFTNFYRRRIRRIIPASFIVLVATSLAAFILLNRSRAWTTTWDAVWAAAFSANWRFASTGTDYFASASPPSPLQHFWSLSVEEQFYFVWPWLMLVVLFYAVGRAGRSASGRRTRLTAGALMAVLTTCSFVWSVVESSADPTVAYFSTFSRTWELGIGALVAIVAPVFDRIPAVVRPILAWSGLAGIAASVFLISPSLTFPGPWALAPVLATAVVIAAGTGVAQQRFVWPLTNRAVTYVGDISYSLYLWHFPVIVLSTVLIPAGTVDYYVWCAVVIAAISIASYHLIEVPLHHSPLLDRFRSGQDRAAAYATWRRTHATRYKYGSVGLLAAIVAPVVLGAFAPQPTDTSPTREVAAPVSTTGPAPTFPPAVAALQADIVTAAAATEWPQNLSPSFDEIIAENPTEPEISRCAGERFPDLDSCTFGADEAPRSIVLIGDSIAVAYAPAFRRFAEESGGQWKVTLLGAYGCTFIDVSVANADQGLVDACAGRKRDDIRVINEMKPTLVVVSNTYVPRRAADGGVIALEDWGPAMRRLTDQFQASTQHLVLLSPPPDEIDIAQCYSPVKSIGDCASRIGSDWTAMKEVETSFASEIGGTWIDSSLWNCTPEGVCPAFAGSTPTKFDRVHITPAFAVQQAPALREAFVESGLVE
ncbi:hypothetical protein ASF48_07280 [Rathayibacter sp. Leaf299]|nr:hypothetical protein ASF48_07280 [Rathayibacter sp. Leaf299]